MRSERELRKRIGGNPYYTFRWIDSEVTVAVQFHVRTLFAHHTPRRGEDGDDNEEQHAAYFAPIFL